MKAKESRKAIMYAGLTGSRSYELYSNGSLNVVELFKNLHADKKGEHSSAVKEAIVSPCLLPFYICSLHAYPLLFFIYFPYKLVQL